MTKQAVWRYNGFDGHHKNSSVLYGGTTLAAKIWQICYKTHIDGKIW